MIKDKETLNKINTIQNNVDTMFLNLEMLVNKLVNRYCNDLDSYMQTIDIELCTVNKPLTIEQLESYLLNLSSLLYFTGEAQEDLGIKEDACRAIKTELYNTIREQSTGTVAERDTAATMGSQVEALTLVIYSRAYKKVKFKVEAGYEMLNSVKKIISRRMAEMELSNSKFLNKEVN